MFSADIFLVEIIKERKENMAYVSVMGDVKVIVPIKVEDSIRQTLRWIGINTEEHRNSIYDDSIDSFIDIRMFAEKYISDLSTDFS